MSKIDSISTPKDDDFKPVYCVSGRGNSILSLGNHRYIRNNAHGEKIYWKCTKWHSNCKARAITELHKPEGKVITKNKHNHDEDSS